MIHTSSWWTIETAGWTVDVSEESTALIPADVQDDCALVLSAFRKTDGVITPEELWVMSGKASPASAARTRVNCGDFEGYGATYDDDGVHWRVWWLAHRRLHVYATFNCPPERAGDHDAVLDWMLSRLQAVDPDV